MKTKSKLSAKAVNELTELDKSYCAKIAQIYNVMTPVPDWKVTYEPEKSEIFGEKIPGFRFSICHPSGRSSVFVPEKMKDHFLNLFGIETGAPSEEKKANK